MLTYTCTVIGYLWKKFPESISKIWFQYADLYMYSYSMYAVEKGFTFPLPFLIGSGQVGMQTWAFLTDQCTITDSHYMYSVKVYVSIAVVLSYILFCFIMTTLMIVFSLSFSFGN